MDTALKTKAFGYLRVSGKSQVDGDGFERQRIAIEKWAAANGVEIVRYFTEEGVSGTLEHREALDALLVALMSNGVATVIVEKLDRLSRDLRIQENLIHQYFTNRFALVSTCEPDLGSNDPNRVFMRQIFGAVAQLDKSNIVLKLRAARQRKRANTGRCEGRKPFGTRDGERAIIERIRTMHTLEGLNYEQIAKQLNAEGIAARKGSWFGSTVRRIVIAE